MPKLLDEIHPGEVLFEDFMKPMQISARKLAADIDVSPSRISELVHGQRPITADTALRLGLFFDMEPRFWLNLQAEYDMRVADRELRALIAPRIRAFQPLPFEETPAQPQRVSRRLRHNRGRSRTQALRLDGPCSMTTRNCIRSPSLRPEHPPIRQAPASSNAATGTGRLTAPDLRRTSTHLTSRVFVSR